MHSPLNPSDFHRQYDNILSTFLRHVPDATMRLRLTQEADSFFQQCALGVWKAEGISLSPRFVEYYNAIYCRDNPPSSILYWELVSRLDNHPGFSIPTFFPRLCQYDRERGHSIARRFVYDFGLILLLFAAADGVVSRKEISFIQRCMDFLSNCCHEHGLLEVEAPLRLSDFLTDPNEAFGLEDSSQAPVQVPSGKADSPAGGDSHEAEPSTPTLETLLEELDGLCGLGKVKEEVHGLINLVKVRNMREEHGLPVPPMSLHIVFMGNPGTGKTTVARLLAEIYKAIGVLSKGQLIEVDRSGLVAGFVGQTALKTSEIIQKALGGILFIDEAYALANQESGHDFGREAIEVLLKGMEDHRKDLVVIVAGYTALMEKFISSNPGLESRFNKYLCFDDYDGGQLLEIFMAMCKKNSYTCPEAAQEKAKELFALLYDLRDENFGNARDVRNVFERAVSRQANRVATMEAPTKEDLMAFLPEDLAADSQPSEAASPAASDEDSADA